MRSYGRRIVFFPGFAKEQIGLVSQFQTQRNDDPSFKIDHVSVNADLRAWHFTTADGGHAAGGGTRALGDGRHLWFGLSVSGPSALRELKRNTIVEGSIPAKDAARTIKSVSSQYSMGSQHLLKLAHNEDAQGKRTFWHFSLILLENGASHYDGPEHAAPFGAPFLKERLPNSIRILGSVSHVLRIDKDISLQVTAVRVPGSIDIPGLFVSPN